MWNRQGVPRPRAGRGAAAALLFLLWLLPGAALGSDEEGCLFCHRHPLLSGAGGAPRSLRVADPQGAFHGALYCSDCHGDARTAPHPTRPGVTNCVAPCHAAAAPPESHRRASWGGLTESHRPLAQPAPPCLLCHRGEDRRGERAALAARCASCHREHASSVIGGVHSALASTGEGGACAPCHPAHPPAGADNGAAAAGASGTGKGGGAAGRRCVAAGCHARITPPMATLGGHRASPAPGRGAATAILAAALLAGLLPGFLAPPRRGGEGAPGRAWVSAPARVPRYTLSQRLQHGAAALLFLALLASAAARALSPGVVPHRVHATAGTAGSLLLLLHLGYLVVTAVRLDLPLREVAFLPYRDPAAGEGKYSRSERADYLCLLLLTLLLAATGLLLRWPGTAGLSPGGYGAARVLHLFLAAAATVHVLGTHGRLRLLSGGEGAALSVVTGSVPLATAALRPGWVDRLVAAGTLVPAPEEKAETAESREGSQVRELLEEGNRRARAGDFPGARSSFEEALRLYPDYAQARFNLAVACMKEGDRDEAARQFAAFLAADPFNPMAEKAREYLDACRGGGAP